jgi:hypothetical protein
MEVRESLTLRENQTGLRTCTVCAEEKPLGEFWLSKTYRNGRQPRCNPCRIEAGKVNYRIRAADGRHQVASRRTHLRRKYGITIEEYEARVTVQGGRCAVCGKSGGQLMVDHDHGTGAVRELLCNGCNCALGHAGDDAETLRKLALYLEKHQPRGLESAS